MKHIGCFLAALGLVVTSCMPATAAASLSSPDTAQTAILHNGVTAGLRFTMPFGGARIDTPEPRLALGVDVYRAFTPTPDPFSRRSARASLASFDFSGHGFERLTIANQTALTSSYDPINGRRLDFFTPEPSTLLWSALIIGAAVGVYLLVEGNGSPPENGENGGNGQ